MVASILRGVVQRIRRSCRRRGRDDGLDRDVGEQRDLGFEVVREVPARAAEQDVGLDAIARSSLTLCCVGLVLSSPETPTNGTRVRWMKSVRRPERETDLARRLEERQALDVADSSSYSQITISLLQPHPRRRT